MQGAANGSPLIMNGTFIGPLDPIWTRRPAGASVTTDSAVNGNVLHLDFGDPPKGNVWDIVMGQKTTQEIHKGDTVYFQAQMRSAQGSSVGVMFEQAVKPNAKFMRNTVVLLPEWHVYRFATTIGQDLPAGSAQLTLFFGFGRGSVDLADVHVDDLGATPIADLHIPVDYYSGQAHGEGWKPEALARIEKIRKGDLTIKVVDAAGTPVSGATVKVEQLKHAFHFGTAVTAEHMTGQSADDQQYREVLKRLFNTVVFESEMKWYTSAPKDWTKVDASLDWLEKNGFYVRGHNIVWGGWHWLPAEMQKMSKAECMEMIHQRVIDMMTRFKGKVYIWDVINEAIGQDALWNKIGYDSITQIYKWAKETNPNVQLAYNDYDLTEEASSGHFYRNKIEDLLQNVESNGGPVEVLGMQSHIRVPLTPVYRVLQILDELENKLHLKLEVTEYDLGVLDDTVHSDYTRDFLTAMFSHPAVQGFTMWGFWEGSQWRASEGGAIVRKDFSLRPTASVWEDLVRHQWWTDKDGQTDGSGNFKLRAFYGRYRVTAQLGGAKKTEEFELPVGTARDITVTLK